MRTTWFVLTVAMALLVSASSVFGLQLITNGSFETGDLTGWTIGGDFPMLGALAVPNIWPGHPELGSWVASVGPPPAVPFLPQAIGTAFLYQSFMIPAGMSDITLNIDYLPWTLDAASRDLVWVVALYDGNTHFESWGGNDVGGLESPGWQHFHSYFDISGITTTPINCTVAFGVTTTTDYCHSTGFLIDNASVDVVPEPATVLLLGSGLVSIGLLGAARRRKKR